MALSSNTPAPHALSQLARGQPWSGRGLGEAPRRACCERLVHERQGFFLTIPIPWGRCESGLVVLLCTCPFLISLYSCSDVGVCGVERDRDRQRDRDTEREREDGVCIFTALAHITVPWGLLLRKLRLRHCCTPLCVKPDNKGDD